MHDTAPLPAHPAPWPALPAAEAGFDPAALAAAVGFAEAHETPWPRDEVEPTDEAGLQRPR
ncbi:MAG: hypothetical protein QJR07_13470, partial [Acetobacteraceae bacterium]|nr:hypothetical protein [Acetobacteraceae bacterium]